MPEPSVSRRAFLKGLAGGSVAILASSLPLTACSRPSARPPGFRLAFFTPGEYRTIERLAAVMLPGGHGAEPAGAYDVARQADALLSRLDPLTQEQFRQFLFVFESVPVLGGKLKAFSAQDDQEAFDYLRAYQNSPIRALRQGFDGLKRLVIGVYYADPRSWKAIGYDGAWLGNPAVFASGRARPGSAPGRARAADRESWDLVNPNVFRRFEA